VVADQDAAEVVSGLRVEGLEDNAEVGVGAHVRTSFPSNRKLSFPERQPSPNG